MVNYISTGKNEFYKEKFQEKQESSEKEKIAKIASKKGVLPKSASEKNFLRKDPLQRSPKGDKKKFGKTDNCFKGAIAFICVIAWSYLKDKTFSCLDQLVNAELLSNLPPHPFQPTLFSNGEKCSFTMPNGWAFSGRYKAPTQAHQPVILICSGHYFHPYFSENGSYKALEDEGYGIMGFHSVVYQNRDDYIKLGNAACNFLKNTKNIQESRIVLLCHPSIPESVYQAEGIAQIQTNAKVVQDKYNERADLFAAINN